MLYFIQAEVSGLIKIGYTGSDPRERMAKLQTGSPARLSLLGYMTGEAKDEAARAWGMVPANV
jgi:hypothetical protein